jgi:hypothetical protein
MILALALALAAQPQAETPTTPPQRIRNVQLQRGQACPRGTGDEIVVCSTIEEPYRIPKEFRDERPIPAQNQSWTNTAATIDQVSKTAAGLPDTCSPIGSGGQTGCALQNNRAWAAERRAQRRAAESVPGGAQ